MDSGILNINKRAGMGSPMVVSAVKRRLRRGIKVGHAGTLDQFATGVLLVLVGRDATKLSNHLMATAKQYVATIRLGATTPTDDPESEITPTPNAIPPSHEQLVATLQAQVGLIEQLPPIYSALKIGGMRASDRVRLGEQVSMQSRPVRIDAIDLLSYEWPDAIIRVDCGKGTYVRSIARETGQRLGVGGYLTTLQRTRVGAFGIDSAIDIDDLNPQNIESKLIPTPSLRPSID